MTQAQTFKQTIPGLLKNDPGKTSAEMAAIRRQHEEIEKQKQLDYEVAVKQIAASKYSTVSNSYTADPNYVGQPYWGINNPDPLYPLQQPYDINKYKQIPIQPKKYDDAFDTQALMERYNELLKTAVNKKSDFEVLIDGLFSVAEKEQFLIDAGYMLERSEKDQSRPIISRKLSDGTIKTITNSLDELFLKEITVKFKNLLLAKATLKMKL